jgi:hypothetical protein
MLCIISRGFDAMKTSEFTVRSGQPRTSAVLSAEEAGELLPWYVSGELETNLAKEVEELLAADRDLARRLELVREEMTEALVLNEAFAVPSARVAAKLFDAIDQERRSARKSHWSSLGAWLSSAFSLKWSWLTSIPDSSASIAHFAATNEPLEYPFQSDLDAMSDDWKRVGARLRHQVSVEALIHRPE